MIWQNPLAWLGTLLVAIPIVVHLLTRTSAKRFHFPTLRFLDFVPPLQLRRSRISDPLLLVVRAAVIVAVAAAIASPLLLTEKRKARYTEHLSRAVVLDTSAAIFGGTSDSAAATTLQMADSLVSNAANGVLLTTGSVNDAISGAADWLLLQRGKRELVVLSDFRRGEFSSASIQPVDSTAGLLLMPLPASDVENRSFTASGSGRQAEISLLEVSDSGAAVSLVLRAGIPDSIQGIVLNASAEELADAAAARDAASYLTGGAALPAEEQVQIFYPGARMSADILAGGDVTEGWMLQLLADLSSNGALRESFAPIFATSDPESDAAALGNYLPVLRDAQGRPALSAARAPGQNGAILVLVVSVPPGSLASATLIGAIAESYKSRRSVRRMLMPQLPQDSLQAWSREAAEQLNSDGVLPGDSDARWFWLLALVLMLLEQLLRTRTTRSAPVRANA